MSKSAKSVEEMVDYVRQLRLHTAGRRAIHVRLSQLEKHFRDEHGRRFVAVTLRPLITNFGATMFSLPNSDVLLVVKDAKIDTIDPLLAHIRRKYRDSEFLDGMDPIQGVSDRFVEWFELEEAYPAFRKYVENLAEALKADDPSGSDMAAAPGQPKPASTLGPKTTQVEEPAPTARAPRMVPIDAPERDTGQREFDPELIVALNKALIVADVTGMLRKQSVMAILGVHQAQPVMEHRFVPRSLVFEKLLKAEVCSEDRWLDGYLGDLLASRVLFSAPNMQNANSIASSLRISCNAVGAAVFDRFDQALGDQPRSTVILEFGAIDVMANFGAYQRALAKIDALGYRVMIGDVDPRALLWLDYKNFNADFVKILMPRGYVGEWLDLDLEEVLREQILQIGLARVILSGCDSQDDIEVGQRLGITLFQGDAVAPVTM